MSSGLRLTVVAGLLLVVIILVAHPLLDLEPTVLRSLQTSGLLLVVFIFHKSEMIILFDKLVIR